MADHLLSDRDLDLIFRTARSYNCWSDKPVSTTLLQAVYDLARMGPTSANCSPARFHFCVSTESRERLAACVSAGNTPKVLTAPVTVIVGMDLDFPEKMPVLFPHEPSARYWFTGTEALLRETAMRNSTLQAAYLMIAARALGLDCGPMSGFDKAAVDAAFFAGTKVETNLLIALGHGTEERLFGRSPRLAFEEACTLL